MARKESAGARSATAGTQSIALTSTTPWSIDSNPLKRPESFAIAAAMQTPMFKKGILAAQIPIEATVIATLSLSKNISNLL
jgi:hypothetical protein